MVSLLQDKWTRELDTISTHYGNKKKALQFVTLQIPTALYAHPHSIQELMQFVSNVSIPAVNPDQTNIGLDFSTAQLAHVSKEELQQLRQSLLQSKPVVDLCTVACNAFTFHQAKRVTKYIHQVYDKDIPVIATELLRSDVQKPGQLSATYDYHVTHKVDSDSTKIEEHTEEIKEILKATEDFQRALDRCIQVEKLLLEKVSFNCLLARSIP